MDMYEFFLFVMVFAFGYMMGQIFFALKLHNTIQKMAKQYGIDLKDIEKEIHNIDTKVVKVPNFITESTNNSILLYNKDTGDFVSQATSVQELAENIYKFNKINFAFVKHDEKQFWFVEGKVRDDLKEI